MSLPPVRVDLASSAFAFVRNINSCSVTNFRIVMRIPLNQEQGLSAVVDAAKDAGICVFVGAGVSQGAGLPSFKALVWNLVKEIGVSEADFSANPDLAYWTQYYEDERDYTSLFNGVYRQLAGGNPTSVHLALTKLGTNLKAVFTTNYDSLIERTFSQHGVNYKRIIDPVHVTTGPVGTKIVHLHGHLDSPDSIVITKDQYHHARVQKRVILHLLQSISMEMPILFVGFSADDWNIRDYIAGIQHAFPDGLRRPHFAITLSSDSAALSRFQTNFACIGARVIDCSEDNPLRFTERLSEFLDQIAIDLSVARQGYDKSPSPADKTKPSVKQEVRDKRDPINIVTVGTLEHQRHEVAPTVTSIDEDDHIRTLIDDPSARLFVLSFGAVACGKTSLLGALIQGMQTPEVPGRLYVDYGSPKAKFAGAKDQVIRIYIDRKGPPNSGAN